MMGLATLLALWMTSFPAAAARPDPVSFGVAVEQGDLLKVGKWLEDGLDPNFIADRIGSGMMIAAWEGNVAMLELFHKHGAGIDLSNRYDEQAIHMAAWKGHLEAVKWLLGHGASVDRQGPHWGALHYAAFADRHEVVRLLIENGSDINARTPNGSTALMMTAREGRELVAGLLLEAGADPALTNESGDSALTWAMRHEHFRIARSVATVAEFANAVRAAPETFGTPVRSPPAPPEIEEILRQLRLAEAAGRPVDELRKKLFDAVARFKQDSQRMVIDRRPAGKTLKTGKPKALMITAQRGRKKGRERAELVYAPKQVPLVHAAPLKAPAQTPLRAAEAAKAPGDAQVSGAEAKQGAVSAQPEPGVPEILDRISRARSAGKPVDDLRKALFEAIARFKNAAPTDSDAAGK